MQPFVDKYQPERAEAFKAGLDFDLHPEDPLFVRAAYGDAKLVLGPEDLKRFEDHLKEKREIPDWFLQRNDVERAKYKDTVDLFRYYDLSDFYEDWTLKRGWSPKHRAALRNLLENPDSCAVRIKPLGMDNICLFITYFDFFAHHICTKSNPFPFAIKTY